MKGVLVVDVIMDSVIVNVKFIYLMDDSFGMLIDVDGIIIVYLDL